MASPPSDDDNSSSNKITDSDNDTVMQTIKTPEPIESQQANDLTHSSTQTDEELIYNYAWKSKNRNLLYLFFLFGLEIQ